MPAFQRRTRASENDGTAFLARPQDRHIASTEEDTTGNGKMDTWTTYRIDGGKEVIARVERDTNADGKPDTFYTYQQVAGKTELKERDEDRNGDGKIDVRSIYEDGKLKRREIDDPALVPL